MIPQKGLKWKDRVFFGKEPRWSIEPDVNVVGRIARQALGQPQAWKIEFFAQGAFNKLYKIECEKGDFMMRVTLPVDPKFKTLSEVATLAYVRQYTNLPVPTIVAHDSSPNNEIGFEWMLMEFVQGKELKDVWATMTWEAKETLVKRMALYSAQLFQKRFRGIGSIFLTKEYPQDYPRCRIEDKDSAPNFPGNVLPSRKTSLFSRLGDFQIRFVQQPLHNFIAHIDCFHAGRPAVRRGNDIRQSKRSPSESATIENPASLHTDFTLGRIVSMQFFWAKHIFQDVPRGPFAKSADWLLARLKFDENDFERILRGENSESESESDSDSNDEESDGEEDDDDDDEDTKEHLDSINRLRTIIPLFLKDEPEMETALLHDDLHTHNILVSETGELQGVVDCEYVSTVPLWKAAHIPQFLGHRDFHTMGERPDEAKYGRDEETGEVTELYHEHLLEYEQTLLRKVFLAEMEKIDPEWIQVYQESSKKRDLDLAVDSCSTYANAWVRRWLDVVETGEEPKRSLMESVTQYPDVEETIERRENVHEDGSCSQEQESAQ